MEGVWQLSHRPSHEHPGVVSVSKDSASDVQVKLSIVNQIEELVIQSCHLLLGVNLDMAGSLGPLLTGLNINGIRLDFLDQISGSIGEGG